MSTEQTPEPGLRADEAVRSMLLLMPRLAARLKRTPIPDRLRSFTLAPRHLSLLSYLLFDGPMAVGELASRLQVAPTTVSLMVSDLTRQGVLVRRSDPKDARRTIVDLTEDPETRSAIESWLANGAKAWRAAFEPLSPEERAMFVRTIETYERLAGAAD
ncbi:MarR family winged helix-turn-helix transcriptional regulator [Actinoallomurus spadix]|uniref:MarR family winged helix-turn-helix transcriptional regulator n=1 Tax=Actinoallomurus spadix TaxID=79912 RepID=A0ABN0WVW3_9ACTN|nr:MarR family winged helix-turn-helix transcriptional regulator [Actinoallomurus spadix]MCO5986484.1 MarR family winged helix-turn-helix transcriptional regulator [Actinoallomurus spadix]